MFFMSMSLSEYPSAISSDADKELYNLLKTISGIGPLTSSALITEIGNINHFPHINHHRPGYM
jgi:hypothetical protein